MVDQFGGPIYHCGECKKECEKEAFIKNDEQNNVQCEKCNHWFHLGGGGGGGGGGCMIHSIVRPVSTVQNV